MDPIDVLYENLSPIDGIELGTKDRFRELMADSKNRKVLYDNLNSDQIQLGGSYQEFEMLLSPNDTDLLRGALSTGKITTDAYADVKIEEDSYYGAPYYNVKTPNEEFTYFDQDKANLVDKAVYAVARAGGTFATETVAGAATLAQAIPNIKREITEAIFNTGDQEFNYDDIWESSWAESVREMLPERPESSTTEEVAMARERLSKLAPNWYEVIKNGEGQYFNLLKNPEARKDIMTVMMSGEMAAQAGEVLGLAASFFVPVGAVSKVGLFKNAGKLFRNTSAVKKLEGAGKIGKILAKSGGSVLDFAVGIEVASALEAGMEAREVEESIKPKIYNELMGLEEGDGISVAQYELMKEQEQIDPEIQAEVERRAHLAGVETFNYNQQILRATNILPAAAVLGKFSKGLRAVGEFAKKNPYPTLIAGTAGGFLSEAAQEGIQTAIGKYEELKYATDLYNDIGEERQSIWKGPGPIAWKGAFSDYEIMEAEILGAFATGVMSTPAEAASAYEQMKVNRFKNITPAKDFIGFKNAIKDGKLDIAEFQSRLKGYADSILDWGMVQVGKEQNNPDIVDFGFQKMIGNLVYHAIQNDVPSSRLTEAISQMLDSHYQGTEELFEDEKGNKITFAEFKQRKLNYAVEAAKAWTAVKTAKDTLGLNDTDTHDYFNNFVGYRFFDRKRAETETEMNNSEDEAVKENLAKKVKDYTEIRDKYNKALGKIRKQKKQSNKEYEKEQEVNARREDPNAQVRPEVDQQVKEEEEQQEQNLKKEQSKAKRDLVKDMTPAQAKQDPDLQAHVQEREETEEREANGITDPNKRYKGRPYLKEKEFQELEQLVQQGYELPLDPETDTPLDPQAVEVGGLPLEQHLSVKTEEDVSRLLNDPAARPIIEEYYKDKGIEQNAPKPPSSQVDSDSRVDEGYFPEPEDEFPTNEPPVDENGAKVRESDFREENVNVQEREQQEEGPDIDTEGQTSDLEGDIVLNQDLEPGVGEEARGTDIEEYAEQQKESQEEQSPLERDIEIIDNRDIVYDFDGVIIFRDPEGNKVIFYGQELDPNDPLGNKQPDRGIPVPNYTFLELFEALFDVGSREDFDREWKKLRPALIAALEIFHNDKLTTTKQPSPEDFTKDDPQDHRERMMPTDVVFFSREIAKKIASGRSAAQIIADFKRRKDLPPFDLWEEAIRQIVNGEYDSFIDYFLSNHQDAEQLDEIGSPSSVMDKAHSKQEIPFASSHKIPRGDNATPDNPNFHVKDKDYTEVEDITPDYAEDPQQAIDGREMMINGEVKIGDPVFISIENSEYNQTEKGKQDPAITLIGYVQDGKLGKKGRKVVFGQLKKSSAQIVEMARKGEVPVKVNNVIAKVLSQPFQWKPIPQDMRGGVLAVAVNKDAPVLDTNGTNVTSSYSLDKKNAGSVFMFIKDLAGKWFPSRLSTKTIDEIPEIREIVKSILEDIVREPNNEAHQAELRKYVRWTPDTKDTPTQPSFYLTNGRIGSPSMQGVATTADQIYEKLKLGERRLHVDKRLINRDFFPPDGSPAMPYNDWLIDNGYLQTDAVEPYWHSPTIYVDDPTITRPEQTNKVVIKLNKNKKFKTGEVAPITEAESAVDWLRKRLEEVDIQISDKALQKLADIFLTKGTKAWGVFSQASIVLASERPVGTAKHEAFHAVFNLFLTPQQRQEIYQEAYQKWGKELGITEEQFQEALQNESFKEALFKVNSVDYTLAAVQILSSPKAERIFNKGKKNGWSLDKILTELQIPKEQKQIITEVQESDIEAKVKELEKDGLLEIDCSKVKAKDGIRGKFTKGSQWEIVKDLKGYPSHAQGGVDVKIGKNGFSFTRDNGVIEAKYGLVLPKIK